MSASNKIAAEIAALVDAPDSTIDTSDIPERTDWTGAVRGRFHQADGRFVAAVHEVAHIVIKCVLAAERGKFSDDAPQFTTIGLRTPEQVSAGPDLDRQGRRRHCEAIVDGMVRFDNGSGSMPVDIDPDDSFAVKRRRDAIKHDIVVALAGGLAEAKYRKCAFAALTEGDGPASGDWKEALGLLRDLNLDAAGEANAQSELTGLTESYLERPEIWQAILELAEALVNRRNRRLSWKQALPLIKASLSGMV